MPVLEQRKCFQPCFTSSWHDVILHDVFHEVVSHHFLKLVTRVDTFNLALRNHILFAYLMCQTFDLYLIDLSRGTGVLCAVKQR